MYPVWLAVAQLPPILRDSNKNIALAALFVGKIKTNWREVVRTLKQVLKQVVTVTMPHSKKKFLKINVVSVVADLIAEPKLLNAPAQWLLRVSILHTFRFDLRIESFLLLLSSTVRKKERIKFAIKEPCLHLKYVEKAESLLCDGEENVNVVGVKGRSVSSSLVTGLPLTAQTVYMHCVLIRIYAGLLDIHLN